MPFLWAPRATTPAGDLPSIDLPPPFLSPSRSPSMAQAAVGHSGTGERTSPAGLHSHLSTWVDLAGEGQRPGSPGQGILFPAYRLALALR